MISGSSCSLLNEFVVDAAGAYIAFDSAWVLVASSGHSSPEAVVVAPAGPRLLPAYRPPPPMRRVGNCHILNCDSIAFPTVDCYC